MAKARYRTREVGGGRATRQPGQVRKEAALTSTDRVARQPPTHFTRNAACSAHRRAEADGIDERHRKAETHRLAASAGPTGYRVLARKYRPASFDDLIGQEPMVRTLSNAFETGRIPQAWMLTGVRGVGKTTTARILARALNYELPDGSVNGPTIDMPELGVHCQAIMESRHVDVLEMDAASHTGVDDMRADQRRGPLRAGVGALQGLHHRRSAHAVDAGLQRAAEDAGRAAAARQVHLRHDRDPQGAGDRAVALPALRSAPRRCARCWSSISTGIAAKEGVEAEPEALALIARAAEGSVRDALSLLDQAIAHAAGHGARPRTCGRCSASPTARASSICSKR